MTTRTQPGFVGRDTDIQQVHAMLSDDNCRLVTILGMGGIGKTSLLHAVLDTLPSTFEHSPVLINGQPITHYSQLTSAITERLGIALSDKTNIVDELVLHLSKKPMLLAIDNFEHLLDASGFIHHLLENAPSLKIIVTSRETLRLSHEFVYSLRGLAVPPATASVSDIADYPSVRLFVNKSLQGRQNFDPDFSKIAEICRLIDGNPLAIDLAAVWTKVLDTDAILAEIQSCVDFLESNLRDTPERHRSIRAVFTGSWQLLKPSEKDVLMRLSIFKDKFTREAAQAIANANLRTLLTLRDKSLLIVSENGFYCLHGLIQQLVYEHLLADSMVANETSERYASYYAELTAEFSAALCGSDQANALESMQHAIHNIRVAWQWSVDHHRADLIDKFLLGIALYFEMRSQTHEGASLLTIDPVSSAQLPDALRAKIHLLLGWQSIIMWQNEKGVRLIKDAVDLLDDYPLWFGMALVPAMNHPELLGDAYPSLFAHIESELNTADDTWQRAWLLKAIGEYYYVSHDYE
ncbi:MAG: AAA family ATPase, partial [Chloroflexota bacterium]